MPSPTGPSALLPGLWAQAPLSTPMGGHPRATCLLSLRQTLPGGARYVPEVCEAAARTLLSGPALAPQTAPLYLCSDSD